VKYNIIQDRIHNSDNVEIHFPAWMEMRDHFNRRFYR